LFDQDENEIEVVLIHSQTPDGQFCAERLVSLAESKKLKARRRQVDGLDYSDGEKFNRGLRHLARVISEEIRRGQAKTNSTVELAATGGFKPEIAIATLIGAVSDIPVHYIHELFASLITIEPIPVTLRAEWIGTGAGRNLLDAFASADDLIPLRSIENLLKQDERLLSLVEIDNDDVGLSLLGQIAARLVNTPHDSWPPPTDMSPEDKIHLESAPHHRPRGWERIVRILADSRYVTSIRYEGSATGGDLKEARDNESDLLHHIEGSPGLTLRISTTATTAEQRRVVQKWLRKGLKI